jgi:MATE family multidrug resistance protein
MILMGVVDTVMAGQVSSFDLAALAIALAIWNPVILTLLGVVLALTGIIAHHFGAKQFNEIRSDMYQGFYLALMLCVFGFVVLNYLKYPLPILIWTLRLNNLRSIILILSNGVCWAF